MLCFPCGVAVSMVVEEKKNQCTSTLIFPISLSFPTRTHTGAFFGCSLLLAETPARARVSLRHGDR